MRIDKRKRSYIDAAKQVLDSQKFCTSEIVLICELIATTYNLDYRILWYETNKLIQENENP